MQTDTCLAGLRLNAVPGKRFSIAASRELLKEGDNPGIYPELPLKNRGAANLRQEI